MTIKPTYLKALELAKADTSVNGGFVLIDGEEFYQIRNYDQMRPFFISLVSHSDHWMFISTTGGLSAGRKNSESALFPYYTDDKIADDADVTGSKSIIRVNRGGKEYLWEPFSVRYQGAYKKQRNLYKNRLGNHLIFEEINDDLGLSFRYSWTFSESYGFVKQSELINKTDQECVIEVLDGIQNILPYGVGSALQANASNLVNAYKKNELDEKSGLGMFMLSAIIVDKAEPSEALKTTTVWGSGLKRNTILLANGQLDNFRFGHPLQKETDIRAERGAYFLNDTLRLAPEQSKSWIVVAEVNQDHADVISLIDQLSNEGKLLKDIEQSIRSGKDQLRRLVGKADGLQFTADKLSVGRHYSNVLFNIMRGGIFDEDYHVDKADFLDYVNTINRTLGGSQPEFFASLEPQFSYGDLIQKAKKHGDTDLIRVCYEYLPLTFSRRHGDPSRPWNKFTISIKDEVGKKLRWYEGNWRDIFQNWEALALSYPEFVISMITKFVNASTIDGYNPYRITRNGIDWEVIEPDDPWSYIGYWGDHQIIYLERLLEIAMSHQPDELVRLLTAPNFVYANVPYRIKNYTDIANNPQDTIDFDHTVAESVDSRVATFGSDGKLVFSGERILKANLTEKLLVSFLAKMTNYVPGGGIWLNTQRPEWNDANNALVGNGVSMVTLYYMRRFASLMIELFGKTEGEITINHSVSTLFHGIEDVLKSSKDVLRSSLSDRDRKSIVDRLGKLGESYRAVAYKGFLSTNTQLSKEEILSFFKLTLGHIDHTIEANKRPDGLYHAYNLLSLESDQASVDHLYEMLEGQVAVLSSGKLGFEESLEILDALKASKIYRADQYSYMLYPNRTLPRFLEKNKVPAEFVNNSKLAQQLLAEGDRSVLYKDGHGDYHFNGTFNNAGSLKTALDQLLRTPHKSLVEKERAQFLQVFEQVFNHKAFTGRSGTFYGYEGLGSIYWHMVSKLLLAVQETIYSGWEAHKGTVLMGRMIDHYYEIRAGIGMNKSPEVYGSFPTDPYSHTPGNKGVQQPGMTGQVKEDVLNRWAELGVVVRNGCIHFDPIFLSADEYLTTDGQFDYYDLDGNARSIALAKDQLAFTYCQVPVIYQKGNENKITARMKNDTEVELSGNILSEELSKSFFSRSGKVASLLVTQSMN
jgi:hypothetical protein